MTEVDYWQQSGESRRWLVWAQELSTANANVEAERAVKGRAKAARIAMMEEVERRTWNFSVTQAQRLISVVRFIEGSP